MPVRMRDVAESAGVSVRTVSNVASGYVHVSAATRARVQEALDDLGYEMDVAARSLRSGRFRVPATVWDRPAGAIGIDRVLDAAGPPPDAVFAFNDTLVLGALRALLLRGLRIPEDVALIGIDDVAEAQYTTPPLSSVSPDLDEIARRALDLLDEQITAGPARRPAREVVTGFRLAVRGSTVG